jgi:carboxymethylenebutenolidase
VQQEQIVDVAGSKMQLLLRKPSGPGPYPIVMIAHHRDGLDEFTRSVAETLAADGMLAVAPQLYHRRPADEDPVTSRSKLDDDEIVQDFAAALKHVQGLPEAMKDRVGIIGHCVGGRMAYLAATRIPAIGQLVDLYGGNIFRPEGRATVSPSDQTKGIKGPVLGLFGADDKNPSPDDVKKLGDELTKHDIAWEFHSYPGAGHAFQNFSSPAAYRKEAAEQAWTRVRTFLKENLRSAPRT